MALLLSPEFRFCKKLSDLTLLTSLYVGTNARQHEIVSITDTVDNELRRYNFFNFSFHFMARLYTLPGKKSIWLKTVSVVSYYSQWQILNSVQYLLATANVVVTAKIPNIMVININQMYARHMVITNLFLQPKSVLTIMLLTLTI